MSKPQPPKPKPKPSLPAQPGARSVSPRRPSPPVEPQRAAPTEGATTAKYATRTTAARTDQPRELLSANPAVHMMNSLHALMKAVMLHGDVHPVAKMSGGATLQAIAAVPAPFVMQFVAGAVFLDRQLVPLDLEHYERCVNLTRSLNLLKAHELAFEEGLGEASIMRLGKALAAGARGGARDLEGVEIPGIVWREIPHAQSGVDAEGVDPEVAAITHTVLGITVSEQIAAMPHEPWPWTMGLSAVRRMEKGLAAREGPAMRVVEFAPEGWPVSRRAIAAAQLVLQVLTRCEVSGSNRRAAAHATLALCLQGLGDRDGVDPASAADALVARMTRAPIQAKAGVAPQCLLVASLVHLMGAEMRRRKDLVALSVTDLIELAYDMERARCPGNVPFDLTRADLLAHAVQRPMDPARADWLRIVMKVCGALPVGAHVQMHDGRVGIVMEPGPPHAPFCPVVMIEGQRVAAQQPVMLVPPNKLRRVS